jgi:hypothetical protein
MSVEVEVVWVKDLIDSELDPSYNPCEGMDPDLVKQLLNRPIPEGILRVFGRKDTRPKKVCVIGDDGRIHTETE